MSDTPGDAADPQTLDVVIFSASGWRAAFEARQIRTAHLVPAGRAGKGGEAQPGLLFELGIESRAEQYPGQHLEQHLKFSPAAPGAPENTPTSARQCLHIKSASDDAQDDRELLVDGPVDLVCLPVNAIHPLPPLLAARTRLPGLRALALLPEAARQIVLLFDTAGLRAGGAQADDSPAPDRATEPPR